MNKILILYLFLFGCSNKMLHHHTSRIVVLHEKQFVEHNQVIYTKDTAKLIVIYLPYKAKRVMATSYSIGDGRIYADDVYLTTKALHSPYTYYKINVIPETERTLLFIFEGKHGIGDKKLIKIRKE